MSAWTRLRDKITRKILRFFGFDEIDTAFDPPSASGEAKPEETSPEAESSHPATEDSKGVSGLVGPEESCVPPVAGCFLWKFGGFDGSKAAEDSRCRVSSLRVGASCLTLKWETGIPGDWKKSAEGFVVAAVFYWDGSNWIGGKFDWIDEARRSRDFKNIFGGYNGWDGKAFAAASRFAFFVVSADGKKRSNIISAQ